MKMADTLFDALKRNLAKKAVLDYLGKIRKDKTKMQFLTGYKTYILAALLLLLGGVEFVGIDVPGFTMSPQEAIGLALGFIFARNGAKTEVKKISDQL